MSGIKKGCLLIILSVFIVLMNGCSFRKSVSTGVGNMKKTTKSKETSNNMISFTLSKGDKLKIDYESSVKEGELEIQLEDPDGVIIEDLDVNKSGKKEITADSNGKYTFWAKYEDFVGTFKVRVDK